MLMRIPSLRHRELLPTRRLRRLLDQHLGGPVDLLLIDQPKLVALTTRLRPRQLVYRPTDLYHAMAGNTGVEYDERDVISRSSVVVATSESVARHVRSLGLGRRTVVLQNGFQKSHFARPTSVPSEYIDRTRKRAVYVGALDYRFDFALVRVLAAQFPDFDFVLIGPATSMSEHELSGFDNIQMLGARPYLSIPAYLQHADIGLLPLSDHPANAGRSSMKLYEYAAAGLAVLIRESSEAREGTDYFTRSYRDAAHAVVRFGEITTELRLASAQAGAEEVKRQHSAAVIARITEHSWEHIATRLIEIAREAESLGESPTTA
jgi:hypothetical protein